MQWKFQKEEHNRRDKAYKTDYTQNFSVPAQQNVSRPLLPGIRFTKNGLVRTPTWYREWAHSWKDKVKREFRRITNKHPFWVIIGKQEFRMAFKWEFAQFCLDNNLDLNQPVSKVLYQQAKQIGLEWRGMVERRLARVEFSKQVDNVEGGNSYTIEFDFENITHFFKFADDFRIEDHFTMH